LARCDSGRSLAELRDIRRTAAMKTAARLVEAFAQTHEEVKIDHVFMLGGAG